MIEIHFLVAHGEIRAPSIIVIDQGIPLEPAAGRRPGRRTRVALQRTAADVSGVAQIATRATTAQSTALARRRLPQRSTHTTITNQSIMQIRTILKN